MDQKTILLVEDSREEIQLMLRALKKNNYEGHTVIVQNGMEALDYLFGRGNYSDRDPRDLPQLILLDINLPKISGLDVLRRLRADPLTKVVPVVMLTSSKQESDLQQAYHAGANSYVVKSIDFQEFVESVKQISSYWLDLNQEPPL